MSFPLVVVFLLVTDGLTGRYVYVSGRYRTRAGTLLARLGRSVDVPIGAREHLREGLVGVASVAFVPSRRDDGGGSWRVRFRHEGRTRNVGRFASREAADRFAALIDEVGADAALQAISKPEQPVTHRVGVTVEEWLVSWEKQHRGRVGAETALNWATYRRALPQQVKKMPLISVTPTHLQAWVDGMVSDGLTFGVRKARLGHVRARLNDAVEAGLITVNPAEKIVTRRAAQRPPRRDLIVLTKDDVQDITNLIDDETVRFVWQVMVGTGLRVGEVLALRGANVIVRGDSVSLSVTASLDPTGRLEAPKTARSQRVVPAPTSLHETLKDRATIAGAEGYITTGTDKPFKYPRIQRRIKQAQNVWRARYGYVWQMYDARRFYITTLINAGTPPQIVASLAGHSVAMTLGVYAMTGGEQRDEAANILDNVLKGA